MSEFPGIFESDYGNAVFVNADDVKFGYDLDAAEWIPIEMVDLNKRLRDVNEADMPLEGMFADIDLDFDLE